MKKISVIFVLMCLVLSAAVSGSGYESLSMNIGTRASSMAGAFTASADDSSAVFWNTAGLARIKALEVSAAYYKWFLDTSMQYVTAAMPVTGGGVGLLISYMNMGSLDYIDEEGCLTGETINPFSLNLAGGYGSYLFNYYENTGNTIPDISVIAGVGFNVYLANDGEQNMGTVLFEAGTIVELQKKISVGLSMRNLNVNTDNLSPGVISIGVSWQAVENTFHKLMVSGEYVQSFYGTGKLSVGAEYGFFENLFVRGGYSYDPHYSGPIGGLHGLSWGIGVLAESFKIDYAVIMHGGMGSNHLLGVTYFWGE